MMKRKGICVQIGLHKKAEYLYLTEPNWQKKEVDELNRLPQRFYNFENWKYIGVDCDCASISYMLNQHYHNLNAEWYMVRLHGNDAPPRFVRFPTWFIEKANSAFFSTVSIDFKLFLQLLGIPYIDVLVMDIEGAELSIFQNYDWSIKPDFVAVESHNNQHDFLINIFQDNGYDHILQVETNIREKIPTQELHFLKR